MKLTQRLIIVLGEPALITNETIIKQIAGFKACTVIKSLSQEMLDNVYHYNKNAVYVASSYGMTWATFKPVVIRLSAEGSTDAKQSILGIGNIIVDFPKILDPKDIDVGDHSSQDSTGMVSQSRSECLLCRIYNRETVNPEHIVYETENFYVVPGTGAFFDGYLMIVPKEHILSVAQFPKSYFTEYYEVCEDVEKILLNAFKGSVVTFMEHGSGPSGKTSHKKSRLS